MIQFFFDSSIHDNGEFVPKELTLRAVTSQYTSIFDYLGFLSPALAGTKRYRAEGWNWCYSEKPQGPGGEDWRRDYIQQAGPTIVLRARARFICFGPIFTRYLARSICFGPNMEFQCGRAQQAVFGPNCGPIPYNLGPFYIQESDCINNGFAV